MKPTGRVLLAFATFMLSCSVDEIDHTDKACSAQKPCPGEWVCSDGRCKKPTGAPIDGCKPSLLVADFRASWTTPNSIRWSWAPIGNGAALDEYRLVLTKGALATNGRDDLTERAADSNYQGNDTQIWTEDKNSELGQYDLSDSTELDIVDATITDALEPSTLYRARIVALSGGCAYASNVASATTASQPANILVVFDDENGPGPEVDQRPESAKFLSGDGAHAGLKFLSWTAQFDANGGTDTDGGVEGGKGWENIGLENLGIKSVGGVAKEFPRAYLELAVAIDESLEEADYAEVAMSIGDCNDKIFWTLKKLVFRSNDGYQVVQAPLSHFQEGGTILDAPSLAAAGSICEIRVGKHFVTDDRVRIDSISLNY